MFFFFKELRFFERMIDDAVKMLFGQKIAV